ncbi:sunset domain-containing protein [Robertmurraya yapensis (ex Hitch et al 2024)]
MIKIYHTADSPRYERTKSEVIFCMRAPLYLVVSFP